MTAFAHVSRAVGDAVRFQIVLQTTSATSFPPGYGWSPAYLVAAAMHAKFGSHDNACNEEQESVDDVEGEHNDRVDGQGFLDAGRDEVEQREHRKDGHEDGEIDSGRVTGESLGDHVTREGQDEQRPQELKCPGSTVLDSRSGTSRAERGYLEHSQAELHHCGHSD